MYLIIWRYSVRADREEEFREAYGPEGRWAALFRSNIGYRGTTLVEMGDREYMTVDSWTAVDAYREFMDSERDAYESLDRAFAAFTVDETLIGRGRVVE